MKFKFIDSIKETLDDSQVSMTWQIGIINSSFSLLWINYEFPSPIIFSDGGFRILLSFFSSSLFGVDFQGGGGRSSLSIHFFTEYSEEKDLHKTDSVQRTITLWGHDLPEPILSKESLPTETDCDEEGRCWWWHPETHERNACWCYSRGNGTEKLWLPYSVIPAPQVVMAEQKQKDALIEREGPVPHSEIKGLLTCRGCKHLVCCDGHYHYCRALPDTSKRLRRGCGTHLHWGTNPVKPNGDVVCPILKTESLVINSNQ